MHFPVDMVDQPSRAPALPKRVWQQFGDETIACRINNEHDPDPLLEPSPDQLDRDLNAPIIWEDVTGLHHISRAETQRLLDVAEQRLAQNAELLNTLPEQLAEQQSKIDEHEARVAAGRQRVEQLLFAERAYQQQARLYYTPPENQVILNRHEVLAPQRHLEHRGCELGQTLEWKRFTALEERTRDPRSDETRAIQRRTWLQQQLRTEQNLTLLLNSRIANLQDNLRWHEQQDAVLDEPSPSTGPKDAALRAWLLEQQRSGTLWGELTFSS